MSSVVISSVIELLSQNKKFPNYQAERRVDIFINYFLERILTEYLKTPTTYVCPEFPLKTANLTQYGKSRNLSTKLDYLCCTSSEIIYVELKTDDKSIKPEQLEIYFNNINWSKCLENFDSLVNGPKRNKDYQNKYNVLSERITSLRGNSYVDQVRIIYISPLSKDQRLNIGKYKVINPTPLHEINLKLSEDEIVVWKFLIEIGINIFELKE